MIIETDHKPAAGGIRILAFILLGAFGARAIGLWLTRPEFMGWFNHAPWYWVQTRGLMQDGQLPFSDLPLLFYLYAALTHVIEFLGFAREPAVINASRLLMCLTPALIAWPFWLMLRRINGPRRLAWPDWVLIVCAAFMPLTVVHMPELLQKNMLGMLLLACLMYASFRALQKPRWIAVALMWFVLIAFTHLGTLAAACLWILAMGIAETANRSGPWRGLMAVAVATAGGLIAWLVLWQVDPDALSRITRFLSSSLQNSVISAVLGQSPDMGRAAGLAALLLPLALMGLVMKLWWSVRASLSRPDRSFWLANLLFAGLLVAPFIDLDVLPRLVLFLPLPLLVLLAFALRHGYRPRLAQLLVGVAGLGTLLLIVGESQQLLRGRANNAETHRELQELVARYDLGKTDLVIAPYAVAPAMSWFLGTRAALVTAVDRDDFERYDRVFVLNTGREQAPDWQGSVTVTDDSERYKLMRQAVPLPEGSDAEDGIERFYFYRLETVPKTWLFNESGRWSGVSAPK